MSLKVPSANGNMYDWVDRIWNPIKGECGFGCSYCYTHRWGKQKPVHLDEKELRSNLGEGKLIFVCSGCDLFHPSIPIEWILKVLNRCHDYPKNQYLLHTKNPIYLISDKREKLPYWDIFTLCVTIESNRVYRPQMGKAPSPEERFVGLRDFPNNKMLTIEPIMDFDLAEFLEWILLANPAQVNIGADSGGNNLPEPDGKKIANLINLLALSTKIKLKKNLRRLLPEHSLYLEGK